MISLLHMALQKQFFAVGSAFIKPGDRVIVENPTYLNATNSFKYCGAELVPVAVDADGVNIEALEEAMKGGASFFYTIPNFGNPSSITMSLEEEKSRLQAGCEISDSHSGG